MKAKSILIFMGGVLFVAGLAVAALFLFTGPDLQTREALGASPAESGSHRHPVVVELTDGSVLKGNTSFQIRLNTRYGELRIPSSEIESIALNHEDGTMTAVTKDLQIQSKASLPDIELQWVLGTVVIQPRKIRRITRSSMSPLLAKEWRSLLSDPELKNWRSGLPLGDDGSIRLTVPVNVAWYTADLPPRYELTLDVKLSPSARTDVHVAHEGLLGGWPYVRVSDVAKDRIGEWVSVRFVREDDLKVYVDDKQAPLGPWVDHNPFPWTIAFSSDFGESRFRNIAVKAR